MGNPRRALKFAMISSACLSRSAMVLGLGLGSSARSLMKGEAARGAGAIAGREGRAPGALFAVSQYIVRHVKLAPWSSRRCSLRLYLCLIHFSFCLGQAICSLPHISSLAHCLKLNDGIQGSK